jgi:iron complex transport system ATP-binding protein
MTGFKLEGVDFYYGEKKAIDGLTAMLTAGKFYGLVGPNGSGKTTFLDLLCGFHRPVSGRILYNNRPLKTLSKKELAREIAFVPQNFYIRFPFTAHDVVMMGRFPHIPRFVAPSNEDRMIVDDVMEKSETLEFKKRYINELSSGERQRVVFARALAQQTPVLVLDEATSNLDIYFSIHLLNLARHEVKQSNKTVISVFQDINLAALFCDEILFLKQGHIIAHGETEAVMTPETIQSVFQVDAKIYSDPFAGAMQIVFKR